MEIAPALCGMLFCYNEERVLPETLDYYLGQGIDLVVFDNDSTDSSPELLHRYAGKYTRGPGRILDIVRVSTQGYEWRKILRRACEYMHARLSHYPWLMTIDADSCYKSPVHGLSLHEFIQFLDRYSYNVVDGRLFDFYPTEEDDASQKSFRERLKHCKIHDPSPQQKIFRYHPEIDFFTKAGHRCLRPDAKVAPLRFLYCHYKWISLEHGMQKVFQDRKPRYVEQWESFSGISEHPQYRDLLPLASDLVPEAKTLTRFERRRFQIGRKRAAVLLKACEGDFLAPKLNRVRESWRGGLLRRWLQEGKDLVEVGREDPKAALGILRKRLFPKAPPPGLRDPLPSLQVISEADLLLQKVSSQGLPLSYHFLMTDFCNAACIFCNQDFTKGPAKQISLEKFQAMTDHIPLKIKGGERVSFTFSGGGDPLLADDLVKVLRYCKREYPWIRLAIRTNGLKLEELSTELADSGLDRLEVSVHGGSQAANNEILQRKHGADVYTGLKKLQGAKVGKAPIYTSICPVVSRVNIRELIPIVERAAELQLDEVNVSFSRTFPWEQYQSKDLKTAKQEDSLFFHQELYDETVLQAKKLAKRAGVKFFHEPLFREKFEEKPCYQPWCTMVVDYDGDIYPCTGGEVWFLHQVKKREYYFGNLLADKVTDVILNESYVRLKRTLNSKTSDDFIPECTNCHNTTCFKGPRVLEGHILRGC